MSTVSLDEFLKPFSAALGRTEAPESIEGIDVEHSVQFIVANAMTHDQVVAKFIEEAAKIGVNVKSCTAAEAGAAIVERIKELEPSTQTVLYADVPEAAEYGVEAAIAAAGLTPVKWDATKGRSAIQEAATLDAGITFAYGAIAETGSVLQKSSVGSGRSIALIPPTHIAVVRRSKVYARMGQILEAVKEEDGTFNLPSNMTVISGPSSTADIELVKVVGVHGPVAFSIIMIED